MKICLSLAPEHVSQARTMFASVPAGVDLVEIRTDWMYEPDMDALLRHPRPPVIITNRSVEEGGGFNGRDEDQFAFLSEACELGADYVDVELAWGIRFYTSLARRFPKTRFILSHHDYAGTPGSLLSLYRRMRKAKPAVIKIATMAKSAADNKAVLRLLDQAKADRQPIIAFCMGEYGTAGRILGGRWDAFLTFGFDECHAPTAPGQVSVPALTNLFRVHIINKRTKIFGLVGNPVSQSRGIHVHNGIFAKKGLNAVYVNFLADRFDAFLESFGGIVSGISVTMPHKRDAAAAVTRFGDDSAGLGAVNTVLFRNGTRTGYNTDLSAIQTLLRTRTSLRGKSVLVLGSGAVARTMAFAALRHGAGVTVAGRNLDKTTALAGELGCKAVSLGEIASLPCDVLMNGTSVGMNPGTDSDLVPARMLRHVKLVFEAVYVPEETRLVKQARKAGCTVITGLEMFQKQAAMQSKLFCEMV